MIGAVCVGLVIGHEERGVENGVDVPVSRQVEAVVQWVQDFGDDKGAFSFRGELPVGVPELEVASLEVDLLSFLERYEVLGDTFGHDLSSKLVCC